MSGTADVPGTRKYNSTSPTIRRITAEYRALQKDPEPLFHAEPLPDNLFEWHFSFRGPPNSVYEGGIYHGKIILPLEYPLQPPTVVMLSPSGRFEENAKICLSATGFHPEMWQPSWTIKTLLLALIGFMESPGAGAIGSLEASDDQRREIAQQSRSWKCKVCGMDHADPSLFVDSEPSPAAAGAAALMEPVAEETEEETLTMRSVHPLQVDESPAPAHNEGDDEKKGTNGPIDARLVLQRMRAARMAAQSSTDGATDVDASTSASSAGTPTPATTTVETDQKSGLVARLLDLLISLCLVVIVAIVTRRLLLHHNSGKK